MKTERMLMLIKCALERSIIAQDERLTSQQLLALVLVQKDLIRELEALNAHLRLSARYSRKAA